MPTYYLRDLEAVSERYTSRCVECQLESRIEEQTVGRDSPDEVATAKLLIGSLSRYERWFDDVKKLSASRRKKEYEKSKLLLTKAILSMH